MAITVESQLPFHISSMSPFTVGGLNPLDRFWTIRVIQGELNLHVAQNPLTVISSLRPVKIVENPTDSLEAKFQNSLPLKVQISLNFAGPPKTGCSDPHFPTASKAQCSD